MKSTAIAFFVFFVCMLLGFTVARSDVLNPVTANVNAEAVRMQIQRDTQLYRQSLAMEQQRAEAQQEADLYLTQAVGGALFMLSAVVAACMLTLTAAVIYWMLSRPRRPPGGPPSTPAIGHRTPGQSASARSGSPKTRSGSPKAARSEPLLQPEEHF